MNNSNNRLNITKLHNEFEKAIGNHYAVLSNDNEKTISNQTIKLFPKNKKEIQHCLLIANQYKFPLFVVSTGKNWGYNSSYKYIPPKQYGFLILSRLKRIIKYDKELGYVMIEPGVTFDQLYTFLHKKKLQLTLAATGASPHASIVAHALERGVAKGLVPVPFDYTCGYEIVLPNGKLLYTDHARFVNSRTKELSHNSFGPLLNGLFTQSNFGVVTSMTIWLEKKPEQTTILYYYLKDHSKLATFINIIRDLKKDKIINGNFLLANPYRILASTVQYPWKDTGGKTPLSQTVFNNLIKGWRWKGQWYGELALYASYKSIAKAQVAIIKKELKGIVSSLEIIDEKEANKTRKILQYLDKRNYNEMSIDTAFFKSNLLGVPSNIPMKSLYWRKKIPLPKDLDPIRDKCGIFWVNAEIPFIGSEVKKVNEISTQLILKYGFEPNIGFNLLTDRIVVLTVAILFDDDDDSQAKDAYECYLSLNKRLVESGYHPYRINPFFRKEIPKPNGEYDRIIDNFKAIFDPNNILSPI